MTERNKINSMPMQSKFNKEVILHFLNSDCVHVTDAVLTVEEAHVGSKIVRVVSLLFNYLIP